ncbi:unnamed protein product [Gongylonema pulchrum]|uniref:Uncharacterized protein n=1 Tax=Gongylonema pulchrum TaxID=637853 RepID=A0A3P7PK52_9BILA|nr:unnamed protein product [Gongylonema pulchrum]
MKKFLQDVEDQVFKLVGRHTLMDEVDFDSNPSVLGVLETVQTVEKGLSHARAMSTMQVGITNTLSRLHSRNNLHRIDENCEDRPDRPATISFGTPGRGIRQMLSTSTFLPRLGRRDSFFSQSAKE